MKLWGQKLVFKLMQYKLEICFIRPGKEAVYDYCQILALFAWVPWGWASLSGSSLWGEKRLNSWKGLQYKHKQYFRKHYPLSSFLHDVDSCCFGLPSNAPAFNNTLLYLCRALSPPFLVILSATTFQGPQMFPTTRPKGVCGLEANQTLRKNSAC